MKSLGCPSVQAAPGGIFGGAEPMPGLGGLWGFLPRVRRRATLAGGLLGSLDRTGDRSPRAGWETGPPTIGVAPIDPARRPWDIKNPARTTAVGLRPTAARAHRASGAASAPWPGCNRRPRSSWPGRMPERFHLTSPDYPPPTTTQDTQKEKSPKRRQK